MGQNEFPNKLGFQTACVSKQEHSFVVFAERYIQLHGGSKRLSHLLPASLCDVVSMAPKLDPAAVSNSRQAQRRSAVRQLNVLAGELGVRQVSVKGSSERVENLVCELDRVCPDAEVAARVREAAAMFVRNGGTLSVRLQQEQEDANDMPLTLVQRHRVLEEGFRLESKAFMLTYNSMLRMTLLACAVVS